MSRFRELAKRSRRIQTIVDYSLLIGVILFLIQYLPKDVLNDLPATGGDTGSHFWPLYTLFEHGLPNFSVKTWNPGNLLGEPHLVHYFPLPFIIMALLGFVMPLGMAFNIGSLIPLALLPHCVYIFCRRMKMPFPIPIVAAVAVVPYLYNESYSMLGGNTLSLLAGQFAHIYAFCFFFLGLAFLIPDLKKKRVSVWGNFFMACTALSHAYVFLIVPVFYLSSFVYLKKNEYWSGIKIHFFNGILTLLLSLWFIWPMIDNNNWVTNLPMYWGWNAVKRLLDTVTLYPVYAISILSAVIFILPGFKRYRRRLLNSAVFWLIPSLTYFGLFFVFPKIGLVDARAIPQITLFLSVLSGITLGWIIRTFGKRKVTFAVIMPLLVGTLWWTHTGVKNFVPWSKWNFSGWQNKMLYDELQAISEEMGPGLSRPRVIFEQSDLSNGAGTIRVFEMLPYHADRATSESLYTQATIVAPMSFYLQARISRTPSCPFIHFKCPRRERVYDLPVKFDVMGIESFIAVTEGTHNLFKPTGHYNIGKAHGPWTLYTLKETPQMAEPIVGNVSLIDKEKDWRQEFYRWFDFLERKDNWILRSDQGDAEALKAAIESNSTESCETSVKVDFFGFDFLTDCPGVPHIVKFAYHDSWKTSTGDDIGLISPGMIAFVPSEKTVRFDFGKKVSWVVSNWVSFLSFVGLLVVARVRRSWLEL